MHFIFYLEVFILISVFVCFFFGSLRSVKLYVQLYINIPSTFLHQCTSSMVTSSHQHSIFFHHNIYILIYKSYFPSFGVVVVKRLGVRYITTSLWVLSFYPMWSSSPGTDHWSVDFLGVLCFPSPITWHILMTLIVTLCRV